MIIDIKNKIVELEEELSIQELLETVKKYNMQDFKIVPKKDIEHNPAPTYLWIEPNPYVYPTVWYQRDIAEDRIW